jgi:hypothetical protein
MFMYKGYYYDNVLYLIYMHVNIEVGTTWHRIQKWWIYSTVLLKKYIIILFSLKYIRQQMTCLMDIFRRGINIFQKTIAIVYFTYNYVKIVWKIIMLSPPQDGFTTTYWISAYHHWCCEFESRLGRGVQQYVIKFVIDLWQVGGFLRVFLFPPQIKLTATI